jgi:hypothetical protein
MAKPNYSFEKRQRELAKKKKKEDKLKEKVGRKSDSEEGNHGSPQAVAGDLPVSADQGAV